LTCLSPVGADPLEDRPAQVAPVQVAPVQVARVLAQAQRGHALVLQQANPVRPRPRTRPWLDRTLA